MISSIHSTCEGVVPQVTLNDAHFARLSLDTHQKVMNHNGKERSEETEVDSRRTTACEEDGIDVSALTDIQGDEGLEEPVDRGDPIVETSQPKILDW